MRLPREQCFLIGKEDGQAIEPAGTGRPEQYDMYAPRPLSPYVIAVPHS